MLPVDLVRAVGTVCVAVALAVGLSVSALSGLADPVQQYGRGTFGFEVALPHGLAMTPDRGGDACTRGYQVTADHGLVRFGVAGNLNTGEQQPRLVVPPNVEVTVTLPCGYLQRYARHPTHACMSARDGSPPVVFYGCVRWVRLANVTWLVMDNTLNEAEARAFVESFRPVVASKPS